MHNNKQEIILFQMINKYEEYTITNKKYYHYNGLIKMMNTQ